MESSMKYINLEGLSPSQIIQKYEELLFQRDNILQQLSSQLNDSQQKYIEIYDTIESLTNKNKELNETKLKSDKILNQQRTDKDLLFIKLNNLITENDKLTNLIKGKKEAKPSKSPIMNIPKKKEKDKIKENKNNIRIEINKHNNQKIAIIKKEEIKKEEIKKEIIKNDNNHENDNKKEENKNIDKENNKDLDKIKNEKRIENNNQNNNKDKEKDDKEKKEEKQEEKNEIKEDKKEEIKEDKNEDKKEENEEKNSEEKIKEKEETKNNEDKNNEVKPQSEKKVITINPEEYLAKRKKKKHK